MSDLRFCFVLFFSFQSHTQCRCKSIKIINLCGRRLGSKMFELYVKSRQSQTLSVLGGGWVLLNFESQLSHLAVSGCTIL